MHIILLSGGSGKRLWPLSNEVRSKQFIKVLDNETSMLQRIYAQLQRAGLAEHTIISTSASQRESILNQLGDVTTVIEPERRNTYPAIALACAFLQCERKCNEDDTVVVIPIDPYVGDGYFERLFKLNDVLETYRPELVLMGAKPVYPAEKYGYILPENETEVSSVRGFKEKPDLDTAKELIDEGALWNCGVFAFKLRYMVNVLRWAMHYRSYNDVVRQYSSLTNTSFDYEVVEKCRSIYSVRYDGEWTDIGTWNTLTEIMDKKPIGDVRIAEDCNNTHVINELEIPVVVMGASDMVIAASPDGILVADKEQSSYIRKYVEDIDRRPMFEERTWGEYKVLDLTIHENGLKVLTKRKRIWKNSSIEYQSHKYRSEVWTVLRGNCIITINGRAHEAFAGDTYSIAENIYHGLKAVTDTEIIEIQVGMELADDGTEIKNNPS